MPCIYCLTDSGNFICKLTTNLRYILCEKRSTEKTWYGNERYQEDEIPLINLCSYRISTIKRFRRGAFVSLVSVKGSLRCKLTDLHDQYICISFHDHYDMFGEENR